MYATFRGRCGGIEAKIQAEMEGPLLKRRWVTKTRAGVKFGDDSRRNGREVLENRTKLSKQPKMQNRMTTLW
jgi:hypothetical protein